MLDAPLDGPVCGDCWRAIRPLAPPVCRTCGDLLPSWRIISTTLELCPRCRRSPPLIAMTRSAGHYEGALRSILHAFKYEGRRQLAIPLSSMILSAGRAALADADCVVPVPLHPWRRAQRGFNQAEDLARRLGLPMRRLLWRVRQTAPQTHLEARARRHNVRGAFMVAPLLSQRRRGRWLEGRQVVLVDDVRTTGATLEACADVLRSAGVKEVRAVTVARADLVRTTAGPTTETAASP